MIFLSLLEPRAAVVVEDRGIGGNRLIVEPNGGIVHLRMLALEQTEHLGSCPQDGTIAVGRHHMDGTIGIECRIEAHARADADILDLALVVDGCLYSVPGKLRHRTVDLGIHPALIDGMGKAVGIDGCGRCLPIGVTAVEQLVPVAVVML